MKREVLFHSKWLQVIKATLESGWEYIYAHHPWCESQSVGVLGYRDVDGKREYLARIELCPSQKVDLFTLCALTGGMDDPSEFGVQTAVRELQEESGYIVREENMIPLGTVKNSKFTDMNTQLFAVNLTGLEQGEIVGDGTLGEEGSYCEWITYERALFSKDPILASMVARLQFKGD